MGSNIAASTGRTEDQGTTCCCSKHAAHIHASCDGGLKSPTIFAAGEGLDWEVAGDHQHGRGAVWIHCGKHTAEVPRQEGGQVPSRVQLSPFFHSGPACFAIRLQQSWCACHAGAVAHCTTAVKVDGKPSLKLQHNML